MSKLVVNILSEAQELIRDPSKWCQGAFARDADGLPAAFDGKTACSWCALGAVDFIGTKRRDYILSDRALEALRIASELYWTGEADPAGVNDNSNHAAVMEMFDRAIQIAKGGRL